MRVVSAVFAAMLLAATAAAQPAGGPQGIGELRRLYEEARYGQRHLVDNALGTADRVLEQDPDNPVATAYKGSLLAMRAQAANFPWNQLSYARQGAELLDRAYRMRERAANGPEGPPAELEVMLLRAGTLAHFPAFMQRADDARAGFSEIAAHPAFEELRPQDRAVVLAWMAVFAERDGNQERAHRLLSRARELSQRAAAVTWEKR